MTAEPAGHVPASRQAEAVVTVPLAEYQRLRALVRRASPQDLEDAEIEATLTAHRNG